MKKIKHVKRAKPAGIHHWRKNEPTHVPRQFFLFVMLFFVISFFALFLIK